MELITESKLRELYKKENIDNLKISSNSIITPSARQYLREKNIKLLCEEEIANKTEQKLNNFTKEKNKEDFDEISKGRAKINKSEKNFKYQAYYSGAYFIEKPEAMTQIFGNKLVYKDHPIIQFRGKIDSMQSKLLKVMLLIEKNEIPRLYDDLNEVLNILRHILSAEVKGEEFNLEEVIGLTAAEIREMSHHPQKHFGIKHILPGTEMGEILVKLNSLRSAVREVEIAAVKAFHQGANIERVDIIRALNRMSSVFYVMMCKYKAGEYK
ncbi:MAG: cobalamin adenosyltransferase [bacterium]